ncbi:hypothetical protein VUR80DRAFT_6285 [Thermomyces stellatus]
MRGALITPKDRGGSRDYKTPVVFFDRSGPMVPWPAIESRPAQTIRRGPKDGPAPRNRTRRPPGGPQRLWPRRNRRPRSHLMARAPPWCFCQETMPSPERATQGVGKRGQIAAASSGVRTVETVKRACYYCHQRTSRSATKGLAVRRAARRTVRRKAPLSSCARETSRPRRATKDKHQLSRGKWPPISQHSFSLHCYVRPFLRLSAHALFIRANNVGPSFPPLDVKRDRVWSRRNGEQNKGTLDDTSTGASSVLLPDAYHRE